MKKLVLATLVASAALFTGCRNNTPHANLKTDIDTLSYELGLMMSASEGDFQNMLTQVGSDSAYVDEYLKGVTDGIKSADDKKKLAYNMGLIQGIQMKMQLPQQEQQIFSGDSTKKISVKNYVAGFTALPKNKSALMVDGKPVDREAAYRLVMEYMFKKVQKESNDFLAKTAKEPGVKALKDGILYKVIESGKGTEHCTATDSVTVSYEGRLVNGTVFDSSANQPNGTVTMSLKKVIQGWQKAVPAMVVGDEWEIYIPYSQGYGERATGAIPPYSTLIFKIKLVGISK